MSSRELIEALRKAADNKVRLIKQNAEQQAEALRSDAELKLKQLRQEYDAKLACIAADEYRLAAADALALARALRLAAEQKLAQRLRERAMQQLIRLRNTSDPAVFRKLARELPQHPWKIVRVHPDDRDSAQLLFPDAEIAADASISGGLDAASPDEAIRITNTFEKRLERAWQNLLPPMMRVIEREALHEAAAET